MIELAVAGSARTRIRTGRRAWNAFDCLLLDDHVLFRESLSRLLASEPDFEMAGHCGTAAEALDILARAPVDVVLLDFDLGEDHGSQFISAARRAGYTGKILMVTAGMTAAESSIALQTGGLRHLPQAQFAGKPGPGHPPGGRRRHVGGSEGDPDAGRRGAASARSSDLRKLLTEREQQVLQGIFEGLTNKEIAAQLGVSESAVKATLQQLFQKTHVRTRSQLVRIALESSLGTARR